MSMLSPRLEPKRLGLLDELVPQAGIVGVLLNPDFPPSARQLSELQQAARAINVQIHVFWADDDQKIEAAFASTVDQRIPALLVGADPFLFTRRNNLANLAARYAMPTLYAYREYALAGGLMSYGVNIPDLYRHVHGQLAPLRDIHQSRGTHRLPARAGLLRRRPAAQPASDHP